MSRRVKMHRLDDASMAADHFDSAPCCWNAALGILQNCMSKEDLQLSRRLHSLLVQSGLDSVPFWADHIIRVFASCGSLAQATQAFCKVPAPTLCTWNSIISAHVKNGDDEGALELYHILQQRGFAPDRVTFLTLLKVAGEAHLRVWRVIHDSIIRAAVESEELIGTALVNLYAKWGSLEEAYKLFGGLVEKDVVSWGVLISGYTQHGCCLFAIDLFEEMQLEGVKPDRVAFLSILKACGHIRASKQGRLIHDNVLRRGLELDTILANTLIDMYGRCGEAEAAFKVLTRLRERDAVSWSNAIAVYVQNGLDNRAFELFKEMHEEGCNPTKITFLYMLKACNHVGALTQGRLLHQQLLESGLHVDLKVGNALVDMYAKFGSPKEAYKVFDRLSERDLVSWGAMIAGYAQKGNGELVLTFLKEMRRQGLKPNGIIFTSILAACSSAGLVEEAQLYFKSMRDDYDITPTTEQYSCMIDLFGRAGCLKEAEHLFKIIPAVTDTVPLKSLLSSCNVHGSVDLAEHCFDHVVEADPVDATNYVLLSRLYSDACMWEGVRLCEDRRTSASAWKKPGKAWIEVDGSVNEFIMGGRNHRESVDIYAKLHQFQQCAKEYGHVLQWDSSSREEHTEHCIAV